jgi:hypothetical protein
MKLTVEALTIEEIDHCFAGRRNGFKVTFDGINNINQIASKIVSEIDPGLLVTSGNMDRFLEVIGIDYIKKHFGLTEILPESVKR